MLANIRAYFYMAVFIPLTGLFAISALIGTVFDATGRVYAAHARLWARVALALAGVSVTLFGAENLPVGPVIVMSNHQSNFDILGLLAMMPIQIHWIAKKELFDLPLFGPSMRRGGYIPLDRSDGRKALKSMDNAAAIIREGKSVVMFPEGTRSRDRHLLPFKRGGFMLAVKARVPVIPATINGSGLINPGGLLELYRGDVTITLHPPVIIPEGMKKVEAEEWLSSKVREIMASNLEI